MKKRKLIAIAVIVMGVFFILRKKIELSHAPVFGKNPVLVSVFYVQKKNIQKFRDYLAKVEPLNEAKISTRINAVVEKIYVDEGSVVKKGALLAELDKKDILARLNSAKQSLAGAEENFNYWQKEYARDENLFKQGAVSEEERDRAKDNFAQAKSRLGDARQNVKFWQANLNYTEIKSPYSGVVARRFVDPGDLATIGKPLFIIEDRSKLKLAFDVPQEDLPFIKKGADVIYNETEKPKHTKIANIFPSLAPGKTLRVEAYLDSKSRLRVGEFIPVKVLIAKKKDAVIVPKSALCVSSNSRPFVFVVNNKNKLERRPVVLGISSAMFVEVKNLAIGTAVVKNPYLSWTKLAAGEAVRIINKK